MKVDDRRAHGPNPRHVRDARRGAQNRAAPFSPPTALRRTVPPQQGGARVFLTTVLPYTCRLDVVASMASGGTPSVRF